MNKVLEPRFSEKMARTRKLQSISKSFTTYLMNACPTAMHPFNNGQTLE